MVRADVVSEADQQQAAAPSAVDPVRFPRRIPEIEMVGRVQDSAFTEEQWLLCYAGSHYIQATRLLYHVLLHADGSTPVDEIARRVSADTGDDLAAEDVHWLITNRLIDSGLLADPVGSQAPDDPDHDLDEGAVGTRGAEPDSRLPADAPLLGIKYRVSLLPYRVTAPVTAVLQHLYWLPVSVMVVAAAVAINIWLYRSAGLLTAARTVLFNPDLMLALMGLSLVTVLFHELGHASALRRAGTVYGSIGAALYVVWPVFYTDVTHVYRLKRGQRIRVDLGGMYFDLMSMIGLFVAYRLTHWSVLPLAIMFLGVAIVDQFSPLLRWDGYYAIADVMGVNEPLSLVAPFLRDHFPWRRGRTRQLPPMRRIPQIAFILYLLILVVFTVYPAAIAVFAGRQLLSAFGASAWTIWGQLRSAWLGGQADRVALAVIQSLTWALIPLGMALFVYRLLTQAETVGVALGRRLLARRSGRGGGPVVAAGSRGASLTDEDS